MEWREKHSHFNRNGAENTHGFTTMSVKMLHFAFYAWAEHEKKFLASKKHDPAFTSKGFTYWKEAITTFEKHQASAAHREAVEALVLLPSQIQGDIAEICDNQCKDEKNANREMLMHILKNVRFLARQGLRLGGSSNDKESNFIQLLHLHNTGKSVDAWLSKKTNKYTSHDIQDQLLEEMAHKILVNIGDGIHDGRFYSIIADECTDCSNKECILPSICNGWIPSCKTTLTSLDCMLWIPSMPIPLPLASRMC